jgi:hypothetical protein
VSHPEKVLGAALIAHDDPTKVLEPGKESLDLPPPWVATERATVLCPMCSGPPVWRNQLHTSPGQFSVQSVRLVGVVANETLWERTDKPLYEGRIHQRHFMRRGAHPARRSRPASPRAETVGEVGLDMYFSLISI